MVHAYEQEVHPIPPGPALGPDPQRHARHVEPRSTAYVYCSTETPRQEVPAARTSDEPEGRSARGGCRSPSCGDTAGLARLHGTQTRKRRADAARREGRNEQAETDKRANRRDDEDQV
jgi:hypothetical protein